MMLSARKLSVATEPGQIPAVLGAKRQDAANERGGGQIKSQAVQDAMTCKRDGVECPYSDWAESFTPFSVYAGQDRRCGRQHQNLEEVRHVRLFNKSISRLSGWDLRRIGPHLHVSA